jgi:hypothetical protein
MRYLATAVLAACGLVVASGGAALAQRDRDEHGPDEHWRSDRDISRFHERDFDHWRGGRWVHDRHAGRFGWWWVVGPQWYFYPAPVYPYPDPQLPPAVGPAAVPSWYYCANPPGYYPYVARCVVPWQPVPAQ